jgi:hypothetical protein
MEARKKILLSLSALAVFSCLGAAFVKAEDEDIDTQTSVVILSVPATSTLVIENADSTKILAQDPSSEEAFSAGYVDLDAGKPTLSISANNQWQLTARSSGFSPVDGYTKAIGDLLLKDAGTMHVTMQNFTPLSAEDQQVAAALVGVKSESHPLQYRILLDYQKDIPGTYTATVTYTLTTNAS